MNSIFESLKVVELSSVLAGPAVGMFFSELGAKVIKIENKLKGGDVTRQWKSTLEDPSDPYSAYYHSVNWGKEKLLLDLSQKEDFKIAEAHIKNADIVISNFQKRVSEKLELTYEKIKAINSQVIFGLITAYGEDDPRPGFDAMIQAETGWMSMNGTPNGPSVKMPVALIDILAAHQLKEGLLVALINRMRNEEGSKVVVSLYDAALASLANQASNYLNQGHIPVKMGSQHPNIAPYGDIYFSKDHKEFLLAVGTEMQFINLCRLLNIADKIRLESFKSNLERVKNRDELNELIQKQIGTMSFAEIADTLNENQIPFAPINNMEEVFINDSATSLILEETDEQGRISKRVRTTIFKRS